jgi:hypothetical protein
LSEVNVQAASTLRGASRTERNLGRNVAFIVRRLLPRRKHMDAIIYLVGLVVVIMAILSFFGLH